MNALQVLVTSANGGTLPAFGAPSARLRELGGVSATEPEWNTVWNELMSAAVPGVRAETHGIDSRVPKW